VWPRQNAPRVFAGEITWQDAASGLGTAWAMDEEKADRVRLLLAVHDDVIEGAWRVTAVSHHSACAVTTTSLARLLSLLNDVLFLAYR
jgi:hypothetical protein